MGIHTKKMSRNKRLILLRSWTNLSKEIFHLDLHRQVLTCLVAATQKTQFQVTLLLVALHLSRSHQIMLGQQITLNLIVISTCHRWDKEVTTKTSQWWVVQVIWRLKRHLFYHSSSSNITISHKTNPKWWREHPCLPPRQPIILQTIIMMTMISYLMKK